MFSCKLSMYCLCVILWSSRAWSNKHKNKLILNLSWWLQYYWQEWIIYIQYNILKHSLWVKSLTAAGQFVYMYEQCNPLQQSKPAAWITGKTDSSRYLPYQEKKTKFLVGKCWREFQQSRDSSVIQSIVPVVVLQPGECVMADFSGRGANQSRLQASVTFRIVYVCVGVWHAWELWGVSGWIRYENGWYSLSSMMTQIRMEMMAPVPRPAAATAPRVVQSPFSSQGHTFTLITDLLDNGGFPESDTIIGTSYTPGSKYTWYRKPRRA